MKKKELFRKMTSGILAAVMIASGLSFMPLNAAAADSVYGTTGTCTYEDKIFYDSMSLDIFKNLWKEDGEGKMPVKAGYVFGGWYKQTGENVYASLTESECTAIKDGTDSTTTTVYAKFVPAYVLSVKAQIDANASQNGASRTEKASIRLVSSVDSTEYQKVGFTILGNNKNNILKDGKPLETTTVYPGLQVTKGTEAQTYEANAVFGSLSDKFIVWRLDGISAANDGKILNVTPYWITKDGTKVEGLTKYVHVEDGYLGYVSVPVNLTNTDAVAAGTLQMTYDSSILKFQDVEFDGVFPSAEMEYQDDGAGTLRFVGSAAATGANVTADGIYANVRFKVISGSTYAGVGSGQFLDFEVTEEKFCDWDRTLVAIDAWDIQY